MMCPKCKSENVNVQAVSMVKNKRKGILYWLLIGWWLELIMWIFLTLPWLVIKMFKPNKYKSKIVKQSICQSCGYSWKV